MNRKILSLTHRVTRFPRSAPPEIVQLITQLDRSIHFYYHTEHRLEDVLDFLIQVRKNIKWDIEMNQQNRVPKAEISALTLFASGGASVTNAQYETLFKWLDRPTNLDFWTKKLLKQNGIYQFGSKAGYLPAQITDQRIRTFLTRIMTMAEENRLTVSVDGVVEYADILCKYGSFLESSELMHSKSLLFDWVNKDFPSMAPDVMSGLLRLRSNTGQLISDWVCQGEFLAHPNHDALIEQFFLGAAERPDLKEIMLQIASAVLNDSRYVTLAVVFMSNVPLENQIRFAEGLIERVDVSSPLHIHHLYKLSQSSENARQVFAYNVEFLNKDSLKPALLANVGFDDQKIFNKLLSKYKIKRFFHPLIHQLQLFKQIAPPGNVSEKIIALFIGLIKDSSIETIRCPQQACQQISDIHSLLWQLKSKIGEEKLGHLLGDPIIKSRIMRLVDLEGVDTSVKASALDRLFNKFIEIKPSDIRDEKIDAITDYLDKELFCVSNAMTLSNSVKTIESQFVHFLLKNRYNDKDAAPWFRQLNPDLHEAVYGNHESKGDIFNDIFNPADIEHARTEIENIVNPYVKNLPEGHPAKKFSHIHNTQMQAICAVKGLIDTHNLMLRLKTGQGKSLIAEMSAIQVMQHHRNVHTALIVTSYEHLAKRDQESMRFLVDAYGYQSILLENKKDLEKLVRSSNQKSIVHVESENLRSILHHFLADAIIKGTPTDQRQEKWGIFNKLFDFENLCLVLDEVDLMTWDRDHFSSVDDAASLFNLGPFDLLDTQQQGTIKTNLKNVLNEEFHSNFDSWFSSEIGWFREEKEKNKDTERISTNDSSGVETRLTNTFGANLSKGVYYFNVFNWDFVSYIRKFKYTVSLSGSITRQSTQSFNPRDGEPGLFDNGKSNLFIELPSFFGPHVDHINLKMKSEPQSGLTQTSWINALVTDIQGAIHNNQPVLVFLNRDKFDAAVAAIKTSLTLPNLKFMTVTSKDENNIERLVPQIGQVNTVTFATVIIGRGVDITVSSAIEEGLHLSIGMIPFKDKEKKVPNYRLLTQMIGRTARQDKRGSFSVITKDQFDWVDYQNSKINPPEESLGSGLVTKNKKFDLNVDFYKQFLKGSYTRENDRKAWILIANLMRNHNLDSDRDLVEVRSRFGL